MELKSYFSYRHFITIYEAQKDMTIISNPLIHRQSAIMLVETIKYLENYALDQKKLRIIVIHFEGTYLTKLIYILLTPHNRLLISANIAVIYFHTFLGYYSQSKSVNYNR